MVSYGMCLIKQFLNLPLTIPKLEFSRYKHLIKEVSIRLCPRILYLKLPHRQRVYSTPQLLHKRCTAG